MSAARPAGAATATSATATANRVIGTTAALRGNGIGSAEPTALHATEEGAGPQAGSRGEVTERSPILRFARETQSIGAYFFNSVFVVHARALTSSRVKFGSLKSSGWPSEV